MYPSLPGKIFTSAFLVQLILFASECLSQPGNKADAQPQLIFQSGFEANTRVIADPGTNDFGALSEHIAGNDNSINPKSNWDTDWKSFVKNGIMQVQYTGGDSSRRYAKVVPEPGNSKNHVLKFWLNDGWQADGGAYKARIQTNIYGINEGMKEFYQSVRVFLTEDFNVLTNYPRKIGWLTISEFWNNNAWGAAQNSFRVTLGIGKPVSESSDLYFILDGQDFERVDGKEKYTTLWHKINQRIKVPIGKWFTMEYYFKEGNNETGRFYMTVTPDDGSKYEIFNITAYTHNSHDTAPDGVTHYNPMKLYTSKELINYVGSQGKTLQIYWDDFKLWKNKRP